MIPGIRVHHFAVWVTVVWVGLCFLDSANGLGGEAPPAPEMPVRWEVMTDFQVPAEQVKAMSSKLDAELSGIRNITYDVGGKHVQLNIIATPDIGNAEKLMTKLRSIKTEAALLQKGLLVYEFVGQNEALPVIAKGRKYIDSK